MGASSSKAAQGAARKFPTRAPGAVPPTSASKAAPAPPTQSQPGTHAKAQAATSKTDDVLADSINPEVSEEFSSRLRQMGVVQPNPTYSATSTASLPAHAAAISNPGPLFPPTSRNATLATLEARRALQQRAEEEFESMGRSGNDGRTLLDLNTIVQMHLMREKGHSSAQIEERLNLKKGIVEKLGRPGITSPA
ncbi:hypothetical protein CGCF415_v007070 [Colletotrichum fructicola]|uniref:Helix-turn-helix domain-containing protein n=2 Tax=Colletotrichum gloeosporioides species complex TaxID=2707338 RepID=L2FEP1_COLFN|nr:uncharacterized protein CGMCC3_g3682 [Colletotrichum fructicola]KAF4479377.1 hypothetical protein CGGC5_v011846 [Colletotrichum fructicola Nara gc5]KAI8287887.1 hypothetical protein K4K60_011876 [Colletotrichum sp. SAR11_57]KAE9580208.1 hypothetical protein CGMCC3_g3682 [Colletotrichum fructicola]KAF4434096.1 hypothetical protein CFRS1_v010757 [Colletotrichum fructicola]KAF4898518.1 hypothetical protein CGCFRS4_v004337 [Colletotrichum fructicola]